MRGPKQLSYACIGGAHYTKGDSLARLLAYLCSAPYAALLYTAAVRVLPGLTSKLPGFHRKCPRARLRCGLMELALTGLSPLPRYANCPEPGWHGAERGCQQGSEALAVPQPPSQTLPALRHL